MQSNKSRSPYSYLHRILIDGAKPFRYRNRIYSLLGITERQTKKITSGLLNLTSAGFLYPNRNFNSPAYLTGKLRNPILHDQFHNIVKDEPAVASGKSKESGQIPESIFMVSEKPKDYDDQKIRLASQLEDKEKNSFLNPPESQHKKSFFQQEDNTVLAETEKNVLDKPTPETTDQKKTVDIPGISLKRISFEALKDEESLGNADTHQTGLDVQNTSQKELTDQKTSIPGIKHSGSNTINHLAKHDEASSPGDKTNDQLALNKDQNKKLLVKASAKKSSQDLIDEKTVAGRKDISVSGGGRLDNMGVNRILDSQGIDKEVISGKIERIRQSMQEFYSKKYQQNKEKEEKYNNESNTSHPAKQNIQIPAKKIVIIKRDSNLERGQWGFWERSYLSRFNMMPLR
jgi:hypothetical protein